MAKVFGSPLPAPDFEESLVDGRFDLAKDTAVKEAYLAQLRKWLGEHGYHHRLTGKIIRLPWADGAAQYMIMNGTMLVHLPLDDAYQVPEYTTRGLRAADLARMASDD